MECRLRIILWSALSLPLSKNVGKMWTLVSTKTFANNNQFTGQTVVVPVTCTNPSVECNLWRNKPRDPHKWPSRPKHHLKATFAVQGDYIHLCTTVYDSPTSGIVDVPIAYNAKSSIMWYASKQFLSSEIHKMSHLNSLNNKLPSCSHFLPALQCVTVSRNKEYKCFHFVSLATLRKCLIIIESLSSLAAGIELFYRRLYSWMSPFSSLRRFIADAPGVILYNSLLVPMPRSLLKRLCSPRSPILVAIIVPSP